ncbi:MAG: ABC transporter permease [Thermoanaerobaculaceae bacterium]
MLETLRQLVRSLRRAPVLSAVVVLTFALGIGATTALFSVVSHVVLQPLPYPDARRLVQAWTRMPDAGIPQLPFGHGEYLDYRAESRLMADVGAYTDRAVILTGSGEPAKLTAAFTTASLWSVLGVEAALGRLLGPGDEAPGAEPVVVLSHSLWTARFAASPSAVGRVVEVDGTSRRIVGVMPRLFAFPRREVQLWLPVVLDPARRDNHHLFVLGRLRPDARFEQVQAEMDAIEARWAKAYTHSHPMTAVTYEEQLRGAVRQPLLLLFGAVLLVLLIASANVAGLLLARGEARQRELAVRASLGAGRWALARRLLAESLVLAAAGGVLGLAIARVGLGAILSLLPQGLPRGEAIELDLGVLAFAVGISMMAGLAAGAVPAWRLSRSDLAPLLRGAGERTAAGSARQRLRSVLVVAETALAVILVAGAALLLRSLAALSRQDPGLDSTNVLTAQISLPASRYPGAAEVEGFYDRLLDRMRALPGVRSAALVNSLPMRDSIRLILVSGPWQPPNAEPVVADIVMVTPDFFATLGNPVVRGRAFTEADRAGAARVVALNQAAARGLFGSRDPLGQPMSIRQASPQQPAFEIVGVVRDVPTQGLGTEVRPQVYMPLQQAVSGIRGVTRSVSLALKTDVPPASLAGAVRKAVWELDDRLAVSDLETMDDVLSASLRPQRFQSVLLGAFAALALVLAAVGLYGLLAHVVGLRRRELAVRLAVGARPGQLHRMVLRRALVLTGIGLALGLAGAVATGRLLSGLLYGVGRSDPASLAATAVALLASATLAAYVPARRAASSNPAVILREE